MLKVLKNLKESWLSVIAIVVLLIVQAAGDLTLPDYTIKNSKYRNTKWWN